MKKAKERKKQNVFSKYRMCKNKKNKQEKNENLNNLL